MSKATRLISKLKRQVRFVESLSDIDLENLNSAWDKIVKIVGNKLSKGDMDQIKTELFSPEDPIKDRHQFLLLSVGVNVESIGELVKLGLTAEEATVVVNIA